MTELDRHLDELRRHVWVGPDGRDEVQAQRCVAALSRHATMLDTHLAQREFMLDDGFSLAHIIIAYGIAHLSVLPRA